MSRKKIIILMVSIIILIVIGALILTISIVPSLEGYKTTIENTYTSAIIRFDDLEKFTNDIKNKKINNKEIKKDMDTIDTLLKAAILSINEEDKINYLQQLESHGIYQYEPKIVQEAKSINQDLLVIIPHIFYNAYEDNYIIASAITWKNDNWANNFIIGTDDIGTRDCFGIQFHNTNDNYNSARIDGRVIMSDRNSNKIKETNNFSTRNGSEGFGFELSDSIYYEDSIQYVGYTWYGRAVYDSYFYQYSGDAYTYYTHTYDKWYFLLE